MEKMYILKNYVNNVESVFYQFSGDESDCYGVFTDIYHAKKYSKEEAIRLSKSPLMAARTVKFKEVVLTIGNDLFS